MRPATRQQYLRIASRYLQGQRALEIADRLGLSLRTVRRGLASFAQQKAALTLGEETELAIAAKEALKQRILKRLKKLQRGWSATKTVTKGDAVLEIVRQNVFSPTSEVGLLRLVNDIDNDLAELRGVLRHVRETYPGDPNATLEVDISIHGDENEAANYYRNQEGQRHEKTSE
jgi:hypothetical protein